MKSDLGLAKTLMGAETELPKRKCNPKTIAHVLPHNPLTHLTLWFSPNMRSIKKDIRVIHLFEHISKVQRSEWDQSCGQSRRMKLPVVCVRHLSHAIDVTSPRTMQIWLGPSPMKCSDSSSSQLGVRYASSVQ